jgi:glycosyltransferase involved in cell wall biosynthesis
MKTISFIIPVYNEEKRLSKTFNALKNLIMPEGYKLEAVIFVNDGSIDKTSLSIKSQALSIEKKTGAKVKLISYAVNRGKGYAVRKGMLSSKSDYSLFFDADMSTPLSEINKFTPFMNEGFDVIIGTRKNGHSTVIKHQPWLREKLGKGFTLMTQLALNSHQITDFTCGFKAFSRLAAQGVFQKCVIDRWGYDAEIIFLAQKLKFKLVEKSVIWTNDERTKVKLSKAIPQTLSELLKIQLTHSLLPYLSSIKLSLGLTRPTKQTAVEN